MQHDPHRRTGREDGLARRRSALATRAPTGRPAPPAARRVALEVLEAVLGPNRQAADEALDRHPDLAALERRDRAFARLLVLTVLRRLGQLDAVVRPHLRFEPKEPRARHILRLGAAQLLFLRTPAHAAVNETVRLAAGPLAHIIPMLNAVLRRVAQDGPAMLTEQDPATLNTPPWLWKSWVAAYGEPVARAIADAHLGEPPLDIRCKDDPEHWADALGAEIVGDSVLRRAVGGLVEDLPGFAEGAWWIQDLAAGLPARLMGPVAGRRVLDIGAAPGGKTMQLAAAGAAVTALELAQARAELLRANLARTGLTAEIVTADARTWRPERGFPCVLLDAPCSATGTIRRHPDVLWTKRPQDVTRLAAVQDDLLRAAADLTAPGGRLVYAVCSLQPEEGAARIERLLQDRTDLVPDPVLPEELAGIEPRIEPAGWVRTLPSDLAAAGGMDGFFMARLRRRA